MNEKGNKERQGALSLLLIFREHLLRIQLAWWHATVHPVSPSRLQIRTADSLPPAVHGVNADVPLGGRGEHASHLVYNESYFVLCFSEDMRSTFPVHEHSWASCQMFRI